MNSLETGECVQLLTSLFPESGLTPAELDLFRGELLKFKRDHVLDAIKKHRLFTKYSRPDFKAIFGETRALMRNDPSSQAKSEYRTAIARSAISTNPQMNGKPEAEIILRNARYLLRFKSRNVDTGVVEFFSDDEMPTDRLPRIKQETLDYLRQAGWEKEPSERAVAWIDAPLHEFNEWCESLARMTGKEQEVACPV